MMQLTVEQRLIKYLVDNTVDFAAIGKQLAKENAELFMALVDGTIDVQFTRQKFGTVLEAIRLGLVVQAIKELRTITGLGLKDAKDIVDLVIGNALGTSIECRIGADRIGHYLDNRQYAQSYVVKAGNEKLARDLLGALR